MTNEIMNKAKRKRVRKEREKMATAAITAAEVMETIRAVEGKMIELAGYKNRLLERYQKLASAEFYKERLLYWLDEAEKESPDGEATEDVVREAQRKAGDDLRKRYEHGGA